MSSWLLALGASRAGAVPPPFDLTEVATAALQATGGFKEGGGAWADLDADGTWDLIAPKSRGAALLMNDGALGFTDETAVRLPAFATPVVPADLATRGILAGDLDNDGWTDLVRIQEDRIDVWFNTGGGMFSNGDADATFAAIDAEGAGLVDLDRDGFLDILVPDGAGTTYVYVNDQARDFVATPAAGLASYDGDYALVADFDLDHDGDLILRTVDAAHDAWFFDGTTFVEQPTLDETSVVAADPVRSKGAVFACDLDHDARYELVWTQPADLVQTTAFLDWDDVGGFSDLAAPFVPAVSPEAQVFGGTCADLDNDGWLEVILADQDLDHLYSYDPLAATWSRWTWGSTDDTFTVSAADADSDGDMDLYATGIARNGFYRNDLPSYEADHHFELRMLFTSGTCATARTMRDDIGGHAVLTDIQGQVVGVREVNGGGGRGGTGWPVLHWGVGDPNAPFTLDVGFLLDGGTYTLDVTPASLGAPHLLVVATDDRDGDGILNQDELHDVDADGYESREDLDSDGDGISDAEESGRTDPCTPPVNSDTDGLADAFDVDSDDDGLEDDAELTYGTDRTQADTDGGGRTDWEEIYDGTNPLDFGDDLLDVDGDGLVPDSAAHPDPDDGDADVDDDGLSDGEEVLELGTLAEDSDTDDDGIGDGIEAGLSEGTVDTVGFVADADAGATTTSPTDADTDDDGLSDGTEDANVDGAKQRGETDPNDPDTDEGGVNDGDEVAAGTDPLDGTDDVPERPPLRPLADLTEPVQHVGCGCGLGGGRPAVVVWGIAGIVALRRRDSGRHGRRAAAAG